MAIPSFNLNYTVIDTCDAVGDWDAGATEVDIKKQGLNALAVAVRNGKTVTFTPVSSLDMSAANTHLRLWFQHSFPSYLQTKALGGIQFFVSDGSNTNYYYVGGSDTHTGAYELLQADLSTPSVDGSANLAAITSCGWVIDHASAARNVVNTWWDYFVFGTGYEVYGGTSGDPITWESLAARDKELGYGLVQKDKGIFFLNAELVVGDTLGINDCYFDGSSEVITFYNTNEGSNLYRLKGGGNATGTTEITVAGSVIKSELQAFEFDMSSINITKGDFTGARIEKAYKISLAAGQTTTGVVARKCGQLLPNGAVLTTASITDTTETITGSVVAYSVGTLANHSKLIFKDYGSNIALYIPASITGIVALDNFSFDNPTAANSVYWAGTSGTLTLTNANGTNLSTSVTYDTAGGTIYVPASARTLKFTGLPDGIEVRFKMGTETIQHTQDVTGGIDSYTYEYSGTLPITVNFTGAGIIQTVSNTYYLKDEDQTIPMQFDVPISYI